MSPSSCCAWSVIPMVPASPSASGCSPMSPSSCCAWSVIPMVPASPSASTHSCSFVYRKFSGYMIYFARLALFAVDAAAREQKLDHAQRHQLRQQESAPLLDHLREALRAARNNSLPAGATAKACNYTLALWTKLTRFLDYPDRKSVV